MVTSDDKRVRTGLSRGSLIGLVLTAVVSGALVAVLAVRLVGAGRTAASTSVAPVVGRPAPDFTVTLWNGTEGQKVHLADLHGKPVVVNFWASWCEPCKDEAPLLDAASKKYAAQGVVVVGLAYRDQQSDALAFARQHGVTYPIGPDETGGISVAYGVRGVPETFFVGRDGRVASMIGGAVNDKNLDESIQAITR